MRKKFPKTLFLLSFVLLASCTGNSHLPNGNPGRGDDSEDTPSGYTGEIQPPMINKIISKAEVNLTNLVSWDISSEDVSNETKTKINGTFEKETNVYHGFYDDPIAKVTRSQTSYKKTEHGKFTNTDEYVEYYFNNTNLYGHITMKENDGGKNLVNRQLFNLHHKGEKMQAYIFNDELTDMSNYTEAYYDSIGKLHIIKAEEVTNTTRIQHNVMEDGFIGVIHTKNYKMFNFERIDDEDYYNYRLTDIYQMDIRETNYDENQNQLEEMATTNSKEVVTTLNYGTKLETDVLDVNNQQLLNAFNYYEGGLYFNSGAGYEQQLDLSSLYVDETGFSTIHHYYGVLGANAGDVCQFVGLGSYHYLNANFNIIPAASEEEEPTIQMYYTNESSGDKAFGVYFPDSFFKDAKNIFLDNNDGTFTCLRDISFELDIYLLISYVTMFYPNQEPTEVLDATIISMSINEF